MLVAAPAHGAIGFMNGSHSFRIECSEQLFERAVGKQLRPVQRYVCVPESSAWLWPVPVWVACGRIRIECVSVAEWRG